MTGSLEACVGHCSRSSSMRNPATETTTSGLTQRAICGRRAPDQGQIILETQPFPLSQPSRPDLDPQTLPAGFARRREVIRPYLGWRRDAYVARPLLTSISRPKQAMPVWPPRFAHAVRGRVRPWLIAAV